MSITISLQVSRIKINSKWKKAKITDEHGGNSSVGKNREYYYLYSGGNDPDTDNPGGISTTTACDATITLSTPDQSGSYSIETMLFGNNKNKENTDICTITGQQVNEISFHDNFTDKKTITYDVIVKDAGDLHEGKYVYFDCDPKIINK